MNPRLTHQTSDSRDRIKCYLLILYEAAIDPSQPLETFKVFDVPFNVGTAGWGDAFYVATG